MLRRLLQGFQQGVKGLLRQHVNLIDDDDLRGQARRQVHDRLFELANFIDTPVGGPIDLMNIEAGSLGDFPARGTLPARIGGGSLLAIHGLGKDPRHGGLSHPPRAAEQKGVSHTVLFNRVFQRLGNNLLAHHLFEGLRAPLSCENEIRHRFIH